MNTCSESYLSLYLPVICCKIRYILFVKLLLLLKQISVFALKCHSEVNKLANLFLQFRYGITYSGIKHIARCL